METEITINIFLNQEKQKITYQKSNDLVRILYL